MLTILQQLYHEYFVQNEINADLVSSHWLFWGAKVHVEMQKGKQFVLKGAGFGDLQVNSFPKFIFSWATIYAHLFKMNNQQELRVLISKGINLARRMGLQFRIDAFRQICSYALIAQRLKVSNPRILIIGDGYGFLAGYFKEMFPSAQICLIDLGKTLFFQCYYLNKAFPGLSHSLVSQIKWDGKEYSDFIYCCADNLEHLDMEFDIAINICSMQEMNNETIKTYFSFLRKHLTKDNLFYCCNRIEKVMEGGEIARFSEYPWHEKDEIYLDELCPWCQYYLAAHKTSKGLYWGKWRVPFFNYYDGPVQHRLVSLAVERR